MPRASRLPVLIILLTSLASMAALARELRADPATGRVRVLYIGDAMGIPNPFPILDQEPSLYTTAVYACTHHQRLEQIKKSLRAYMPRTYSRFLNHDVVILSDANRKAFTGKQLSWMKEGVVEDGQGLVMIGGAESFVAGGGASSWRPTEVADVLPCDMLPNPPPPIQPKGRSRLILELQRGCIKVNDPDDVFVRSLPFDEVSNYALYPSGGSLVDKRPFLMWWDIGEGRSMAQSGDWTPAAGSTFMGWEYYPDYCINMMLFLAGVQLPEDLEVTHLLRRRMMESKEGIDTLYAMSDMIERLGGNTQALNLMVIGIASKRTEAVRLYVEARPEEALDVFDSVLVMCKETMDEALRVRDRASFWIFFTEWCVVTGTFMFAGGVLWMLMVRRRLFKEVEYTRGKSRI